VFPPLFVFFLLGSYVKTSILPFEDVFDVAADGVPVVKRTLIIRGMPLLPGARCRAGFRFAGTDISEHIDEPLVVFERPDHLEFLGFASYTPDKPNKGWVKGWGVVRKATYSLESFFPTQEQAEETRQKLGDGFEVVFGSKRIGSNDDFTY
jgi:hypothetical protein